LKMTYIFEYRIAHLEKGTAEAEEEKKRLQAVSFTRCSILSFVSRY
jgi:hypothetical protein